METYLIAAALVFIAGVAAYFVWMDRKSEAEAAVLELKPTKAVDFGADWEGPMAYHVAFNVGALKYREQELKVSWSPELAEEFQAIVMRVFNEGYEAEVTDDWTQGRDCENQAMRIRDLAAEIGIPHDAISLVTCQNIMTSRYHVMGCLHCFDGDVGFDNDGSSGPFENYFGKYTDIAMECIDGKWKRVHRI